MSDLNHPLPSDQAQTMLKALADPLRLRVVQTLATKEHCVCDLTDALGQAQSKLSFHIKVLKDAGLLLDRQDGRWIHYRLNPEAFEALESWLCALARICKTTGKSCSITGAELAAIPAISTEALAS